MSGINKRFVAILRVELAKGPRTIKEVAKANGSSNYNGDWYKALAFLKAEGVIERHGRLYWLNTVTRVAVADSLCEETLCAVCRHLESTADERLAALLEEQAAVREELRCEIQRGLRQRRGADRRKYRTEFNGGIRFGREFDETLPKVATGGVG